MKDKFNSTFEEDEYYEEEDERVRFIYDMKFVNGKFSQILQCDTNDSSFVSCTKFTDSSQIIHDQQLMFKKNGGKKVLERIKLKGNERVKIIDEFCSPIYGLAIFPIEFSKTYRKIIQFEPYNPG